MELLQLKYFEIVAKYENMSKAADELKIAQPAVSQSIARLEDELEVKLFERRGKRIFLNENGKYLLKKTPAMLEPFHTLKLELADLTNNPVQHINLLVHSASLLIPELLMTFRKSHSNIEFSLIQHESTSNFDVCITSSPFGKIDQSAIVLLEEEIVLAVPATSSLVDKKQVNLKDIEGVDFISFGKGSAMRSITDYYCNLVNFKPHIVFESDNPSTVRGLIETGLGIAFYPLKTWGALSSSTVKSISIADVNCRRILFIKIPEHKYVSKAVIEFVKFSQQFYKNLNYYNLS